MKQKSILILGDSWGSGEWSHHRLPNYMKHLGSMYDFNRFFKKLNYKVTNLSTGGNSMIGLRGLLMDELIEKKNNYDFILYIQTDIMRNICCRSIGDKKYDLAATNILEDLSSWYDILYIQKNILHTEYEELDKYNVPIYLIGGCSELNLHLLKKYKNLIPCIPSWPKFHKIFLKHPLVWNSDWINFVDYKKMSEFDLDNFLFEEEKRKKIFLSKWYVTSHPSTNSYKNITLYCHFFFFLNKKLSSYKIQNFSFLRKIVFVYYKLYLIKKYFFSIFNINYEGEMARNKSL